MALKEHLEILARECGVKPKQSTGVACTTFAIGGPLNVVELGSISEAAAVMRCLVKNQIPYRVLGGGSNLLVPDAGCSEIILRLGGAFLTVEAVGPGSVRVGGGMSLMRLSRDLSNDGYSGLEFAGGIPASVGGATWMNAGAHGGQMADVLREITVVRRGGHIDTLQAKDLPYRYRYSGLPNDCCVVEIVVELVPSSPGKAAQLRQEFLAERKKHQPLQFPSAGSIFKNPPGDRSAGRLIEALGLRGSWEGGAQVSEMHGNWIVNPNRTAAASDVAALIDRCREAARTSFSLELEPELVRW